MTLTDDPIADAARYEEEQEQRLARLPVCDCCGEPIQQEKAVYYCDNWYCEECEHGVWQLIRPVFLEDV